MNLTPPPLPGAFDSEILGRRPRNLTSTLAGVLANLIEQGLIKVGEKLPAEKLITQEHGVSRTVVREAISQLQSHGLVETRHGIGTFVIRQTADVTHPETDRTLSDVLSVIELRIAIEVEAAGLAATRRSDEQLRAMEHALAILDDPMTSRTEAAAADYDFHQQIALATDNRYFADFTEHLGLTLIPRTRLNSAALANTAIDDYNARLRREHRDILETIAMGDAGAARAAMYRHLSNIRQRLSRAYQQRGS